MTKLTREELIQLCDDGIVPVGKWCDRDSAGAQKQLGKARALLSAGCEFCYAISPEQTSNTIWIEIRFPGFNAFEEGIDMQDSWDTDLFYIPTRERLEGRNGKDWY